MRMAEGSLLSSDIDEASVGLPTLVFSSPLTYRNRHNKENETTLYNV